MQETNQTLRKRKSIRAAAPRNPGLIQIKLSRIKIINSQRASKSLEPTSQTRVNRGDQTSGWQQTFRETFLFFSSPLLSFLSFSLLHWDPCSAETLHAGNLLRGNLRVFFPTAVILGYMCPIYNHNPPLQALEVQLGNLSYKPQDLSLCRSWSSIKLSVNVGSVKNNPRV